MFTHLHNKLKSQLNLIRTKDKIFFFRPLLSLILFALVLSAYALDSQQNDLAEHLVRLHVLANSNEETDQALKLAVRDAVLKEATPWLCDIDDRERAKACIANHKADLKAVANAVITSWGYDYPVEIRLEKTWFPTKVYDNFSLPAGEYEALRILIGEAQGDNWWCVVYPPLCLESATNTQEIFSKVGVTEGELSLIDEDKTTGYAFAFRSVELWEKLKHSLD